MDKAFHSFLDQKNDNQISDFQKQRPITEISMAFDYESIFLGPEYYELKRQIQIAKESEGRKKQELIKLQEFIDYFQVILEEFKDTECHQEQIMEDYVNDNILQDETTQNSSVDQDIPPQSQQTTLSEKFERAKLYYDMNYFSTENEEESSQQLTSNNQNAEKQRQQKKSFKE